MASKLKGNMLVGQSGGPTAVINSSLAGVVQEALKHPEIDGIYGMLHGIQGVFDEKFADLRSEKPEVIEGLRHTPAAALGSCRRKLKAEDYARILEIFKKHNIRYLFYIGGNDSADTSYQIDKLAHETGYEMRVIGVPKTVDNDLAVTDHCPGYGSAARYLAMATLDAGFDTEAIGNVDRVKVIEAMGRNAGWLAMAGTLAAENPDQAPHLTYLPEVAFNEQNFLADVDKTVSRLGYCLIVASEGIRGADGNVITDSKEVDSFGHVQLGGVADYLCKLVTRELKIKARYDKPGTLQRASMACASSTDLDEAYRVGHEAVLHATNGITGQMVVLDRISNNPYKCETRLAPLSEVANAEHKVPRDFINEAGNGVTAKYLEYARPLIGDPLPKYVRLAKKLAF